MGGLCYLGGLRGESSKSCLDEVTARFAPGRQHKTLKPHFLLQGGGVVTIGFYFLRGTCCLTVEMHESADRAFL